MPVETWLHHIHDMEALRAGRITPKRATAMWIKHWHIGARQLKTYDRMADHQAQQDCA